MVPFHFFLGHEDLKDPLFHFVLIFFSTSFTYLGLHNFALVTVTALFAVCSFNETKGHASVETSHNWKTIGKLLNMNISRHVLEDLSRANFKLFIIVTRDSG